MSTDAGVPGVRDDWLVRRLETAERWLIDHRARLLAAVALAAIAGGGALHATGNGAAGDAVWRLTLALLALELAVEVARTMLVERRTGVDTIALVAMVGAGVVAR